MKRARQKLGHKPRCTASKRTRLSTADVRPQRSALDGHDAMLAHVLSLKPPSLPSLFRIRATARAPGRHLTPSLSRNTFSQPTALKVSSWMARSRAPVLTRASTVDRMRLTSEIRSEGLQLGPWWPRGHGRGGGAWNRRLSRNRPPVNSFFTVSHSRSDARTSGRRTGVVWPKSG